MKLSRAFVESLIFGKAGRRFTQDSPVLPDVWIHFGDRPTEPLDLLLTPHKDSTPGRLVVTLRERLDAERKARPRSAGGHRRASPEVAYNGGFAVARLYFDEVVRVLLPMTQWWQDYLVAVARDLEWEPDSLLAEGIGSERVRQRLIDALRRLGDLVSGRFEPLAGGGGLPVDLVWMINVVGHLAWAMGHSNGDDDTVVRLPGVEPATDDTALPPPDEAVVAALIELVQGLRVPRDEGRGGEIGGCPPLYLVNRNRKIEGAVARSVLAVKADAGRRLFEISASELRWAVIDSGIDALHPAFVPAPDPDPEKGEVDAKKNDIRPEDVRLRLSRVRRTYDFTRVRQLLDPASLHADNERLPERLREALRRVVRREGESDESLRHRREEQRRVRDVRNHLQSGRAIDWELLEPFLRVPDEGYDEAHRPRNEHGTHVAGILGGDWPAAGAVGVCPDVQLLDFRVIDPDADNDEFPVLAALQFIRHLNSQSEVPVVHGVNLSLSILHDVANYACGRTPVCEECERVVAAGVVVVAAAGNSGHLRYITERQGAQLAVEGYHTVSITDPGNAEGVITVGATHRSHPHTYGVSYFSSRGPTGDGRRKPDLVAPGEKITAPVPHGGQRRKDGTSMAAPHVSGAAALLMARHNELVGDPRRVKRILCDTATDLGREPYFQGAGMLDVLRALQAV